MSNNPFKPDGGDTPLPNDGLCKWCHKPKFRDAVECDACHELVTRVEANPALACRVLAQAEQPNDVTRLRKLREMCGYVEDGSASSLSLGQDDATNNWIVGVGRNRYCDASFRGAIDAAVAGETRDSDAEARK